MRAKYRLTVDHRQGEGLEKPSGKERVEWADSQERSREATSERPRGHKERKGQLCSGWFSTPSTHVSLESAPFSLR